jgi:hypothetical protein
MAEVTLSMLATINRPNYCETCCRQQLEIAAAVVSKLENLFIEIVEGYKNPKYYGESRSAPSTPRSNPYSSREQAPTVLVIVIELVDGNRSARRSLVHRAH